MPPDTDGNVSVASLRVVAYKDSFSLRCDVEGSRRYAITNVVVRNLKTDEQRLLFSRPVNLASIAVPNENCAKGEGPAPCGTVLWVVRDEDTNHDDVLNYEDAAVLYLSDLTAAKLVRLSPHGTSVERWTWEERSGEIELEVSPVVAKGAPAATVPLRDLLKVKLQAPAEAVPVLNPSIAAELRKSAE